MNGQNLAFITDPAWYIGQRAINSLAWFHFSNIREQQNNQLYMELIARKQGAFDLQEMKRSKQDGLSSRQVILAPVRQGDIRDPVINAYWCPFIQGMVLPGYVDVPRRNPAHRFIFTAAMNGCALVVTESPLGAHMMRVYHHQHPGSQPVNDLIKAQGQEVISYIAFDDYGRDNGSLPAPNGFNFLYYRKGGWRFALQPQLFNMVTQEVWLNPGIQTSLLDAY
ncbi:hypothetical protein ACUHMQ_01915 [Chitinimonas sp. PSY-7]|uniref:hypothetical protein n=1 Tax=Chitinimonas sp. PSY-7 TaxID=3459088 RepID=UPI004040397C